MPFKPQYKLTDKIVGMLTAIAEAKAAIDRAKLLPKQELRLRRQALIRKKQPLIGRVVLKIHKLVTDKTLPDEQCGNYRNRPVYVVRRRFGFPDEIVYTGPEAKMVKKLMTNLILWIHESEKQDVHPAIVAGIAHQEIAAIHPFADGNGRTARALATLLLYQRGFDFRRLFALEDYYNK